MLGPLDYSITAVSVAAELCVVVYLCRPGNFLRYISLTLYMFAAAVITVLQVIILERFGASSNAYFYTYYYTDALLTISLFFVIMSLYHQVFQQMGVGKYVRTASVLLFSGTVLVSLLMVHSDRSQFTVTHAVVEMGQNLYFVGVVLTYLLWVAVIKLRETRTRLIQLVLALGIFFSADATGYALRNLFPMLEGNFLKWIPPLAGTFLPLAWAYTFTRVPEEARLATARVATRTSARALEAHQHS